MIGAAATGRSALRGRNSKGVLAVLGGVETTTRPHTRLRPPLRWWLRIVVAVATVIASFAVTQRPALAAPAGFLVAIDAGHGGSDPGTVSPYLPLQEKDVTLRLSRLPGAACRSSIPARTIASSDWTSASTSLSARAHTRCSACT